MLIFEVPNIGFKICLILPYKDSNFWYFSCICKVTSKVAHRNLFYNKNQRPTPMLPENFRKPMIF